MDILPLRIFPLGDNAATVEFGNEMSVELNAAAIRLADHFTKNPFPGFVEAVPAIASTTIFYRSQEVLRELGSSQTAFAAVEAMTLTVLRGLAASRQASARLISVPVSFEPDDALDLETIAECRGYSQAQVVEIFLSMEYRVFMLGFLPGFPYMGLVDERIAVPRRKMPRLSVPKGSVGIAGRQTGIYSSASPGGWQIIGRCDIDLFDPEKYDASYFSPGDRVRFVRA